MKLTKSILVAALVVGGLFAGNTASFAQNGGAAAGAGAAAGGAAANGARRGGAMTSDAMITRFQTALGETNKLSDAVVAKVKPVLDDMIAKTTALRTDTTVAQADRATKRTEITTAASDAIKAIVTPSQFTVIQPLLQRGGGRRGGAGAAAPATPAPGA